MLKDFDRELVAFLDSTKTENTELIAAIEYMLASGGKRLRPRIFTAISFDLQIQDRAVAQIALAIEMIHTASLIHDDLPAIDNDNLRRGMPSCHVKFSESTALIGGDFLVAASFLQITGSDLSAELKVRVLEELLIATENINLGQYFDLKNQEGQEKKTNYYKTGSLFSVCFKLPFLMKAYDSNIVKKFSNLGYEYGEYFQLLNDHLDLLPDTSESGRNYSSDIKNRKNNLLSGKDLSEQKLILNECQQELGSKFGKLRKALDIDFANLSDIIKL